MRIPSQFISNCYAKILDIFYVRFNEPFLPRYRKLGYFFIRFFVIYILLHLTGWNLMPHFHAQHSIWSMSFWSFSAFSVSLISHWQTQSSAKSSDSEPGRKGYRLQNSFATFPQRSKIMINDSDFGERVISCKTFCNTPSSGSLLLNVLRRWVWCHFKLAKPNYIMNLAKLILNGTCLEAR